MKKILTTITLIVISLIMPTNASAISTTKELTKIDITKNCNLTLNYYYDDYIFDNTIVKLYYIASVTTDFKYQLSSNFSNYPLKINDLTLDNEWNYVKHLLDDYIITDNIKETTFQTIKNNTVNLTDLKPGLYFIKTNKISTNNSNIIFDTSLISIPNLTEEGTWDYDVDVYLKAEEQFINNEEQSPNTGDNISLYFYSLVYSFIAIIILIVSFTLKRSNIRNRR